MPPSPRLLRFYSRGGLFFLERGQGLLVTVEQGSPTSRSSRVPGDLTPQAWGAPSSCLSNSPPVEPASEWQGLQGEEPFRGFLSHKERGMPCAWDRPGCFGGQGPQGQVPSLTVGGSGSAAAGPRPPQGLEISCQGVQAGRWVPRRRLGPPCSSVLLLKFRQGAASLSLRCSPPPPEGPRVPTHRSSASPDTSSLKGLGVAGRPHGAGSHLQRWSATGGQPAFREAYHFGGDSPVEGLSHRRGEGHPL